MNTHRPTPDDRGWIALASVETTSTFDELHRALTGGEQPCRFEWIRRDVAPGAVPVYDLHVESTDSTAASCTGRSLLAQLTDAADRGMLTRFRIVRGADLLHHHAWNDSPTSLPIRDAADCDETSRAAQPDIATGRQLSSRH